MPRKAKGYIFGVFDEQAVSVLVVLLHGGADFGRLLGETRLSKASLYRVLERLELAEMVTKDSRGYKETSLGRQIMHIILGAAQAEGGRRMDKVEQRLSEMERDYSTEHRLFHSHVKWERTAEKPLIEVMAVRRMTNIESLLFQQKFQEEVVGEEARLQRSPSRTQRYP
jgi:predicted transcriptional regulator